MRALLAFLADGLAFLGMCLLVAGLLAWAQIAALILA